MFTKLASLGVAALNGFLVTVEVDLSGGLPQFAIVGLPDNAVKEATDRVRSALKNMSFQYPVSRITVNLAPADIKKTGPVYDLPVLMGILAASGQIRPLSPDVAFVGELSLDGAVRPVTGILPMALACREHGIRQLYLPKDNAREAAVVEGLEVFGLETARQAIEHLAGEVELPPEPHVAVDLSVAHSLETDFSEVHGQYEARRAMEIAAAGLHNILMVGPPGSGKSMLAKRLPGILPPMDINEAIETSKIYSVSGALARRSGTLPFVTTRPFRSPHHSVSAAGLAGGGAVPRPGEISLAHNGVLFLDELPEFHRDALEVLRQPMEDGVVTVSRVSGTTVFPSRFMLVAAMNPCPCGYIGHPTRECHCQPGAIERYSAKVSGPLLDRIDLHVNVQPVEYDAISSASGGETSGEILSRVQTARRFACERSGENAPPNSMLAGKALRQSCVLTGRAQTALKQAFDRLGLSARGYDKVLRVSRTIADLDRAEQIDMVHISEAIQYRSLGKNYGYSK